MSLLEKLLDQLKELNLTQGEGIDGHTLLFESGLLESLTLMRLAQWIEAEVGGQVDLTTFNILEEWKTPKAIVNFIEIQKASPS